MSRVPAGDRDDEPGVAQGFRQGPTVAGQDRDSVGQSSIVTRPSDSRQSEGTSTARHTR